jgi:hypothetical protein
MISRQELREQLGSLAYGSRSVRPKIEVSADEAAALLSGLVNVNMKQLSKAAPSFAGTLFRGYFPVLTGIQTGRVRYERFDPDEEWKTWDRLVGEMSSSGVARGDCEDLSSAVAAELRFAGIPARTYVYKSGPTLYHVVVKTDRWGVMDPSRAAGMEGDG